MAEPVHTNEPVHDVVPVAAAQNSAVSEVWAAWANTVASALLKTGKPANPTLTGTLSCAVVSAAPPVMEALTYSAEDALCALNILNIEDAVESHDPTTVSTYPIL